MASDWDTVRVLRALFGDMPHAPQGLPHAETMAWIQRSMTGFDGGEAAYAVEHITRSALLDVVLRLREDGHLRDEPAFDATLKQLATPEGRSAFMDWCIQAQRGVDATARLLNRAKRPWSAPPPLFRAEPADIERFVAGMASGPGPLTAEYAARDDVRAIGVFDAGAEAVTAAVHEFDWGFVVETPAAWRVHVAEVWRRGTVGYLERFMQAWVVETAAEPGRAPSAVAAPAGITAEAGVGAFCSLGLRVAPSTAEPAHRRWMGEVFIAQMLPHMAALALDGTHTFPADLPTGF